MAKRNFIVCLFVLLISVHTKGQSHSGTSLPPFYHFFKDEVHPEREKKCFEGAYYRKLVSSRDQWLGISGVVVLPNIIYDPGRANPSKPGQFLDNASVYLGGSMEDQETDIGLIWEVVKDKQGNVSKERKAFRPFLRRTDHASGQKATYLNAPAIEAYYWYPGEEVSMSVRIIAEKKLRFIIEGAGKRFEQDFECDGYRPGGKGEFKRVNAIDQVANEGKPVSQTKTRVEAASWKQTSLFRSFRGQVVQVPFHQARYTEMTCPAQSNFRIKTSKAGLTRGAEDIDISGEPYLK